MGKIINIAASISFTILAILYKDKLEFYFNYLLTDNQTKDGVYSSSKLAEFNGIIRNELYLALLGTIFDVSKGIKHYGQGSPYNYFVGKDGSRAFVTGNFNDLSDNKDHVLDLTCNELVSLLNWKQTFNSKYPFVGIVAGRYYDSDGVQTEYTNQLNRKTEHCESLKKMAEKEDKQYPPCNISWNEEEGTRVWCTASSGGITRSWVGVPRQLYKPGEKKPRCACVNIDEINETGLFKEYENCSTTSTTCYISN